ncbi:MAG TPA: DegT/DnrJ/EryC1/StrS family aminotransferase, partial [Cytophagaceae bacterium]
MRGFTPDKPIPLLTPNLGEVESAYVEKCIVSNWVAYNGPMVKEFEEKISRYTGATYCVATNTGTSALHLSLLCLGVKHRDLVITTPFTFVSPVNTIKYVGADPVFI